MEISEWVYGGTLMAVNADSILRELCQEDPCESKYKSKIDARAPSGDCLPDTKVNETRVGEDGTGHSEHRSED